MQGAASVQVNVDASGYGNFAFPDQAINFSAGNYRWVHIWVKPLTEGSWVSFHCWDSTKAGWRDMNGDKNGDKLFAVNEDLQLNQWNELWIDLDRNVQGYVGGTVRGVHMHASPGAVLMFDGIYTCSRNWSTYYYHTDYLNSPRAMTDASGNVVWRQDYYAWGSEAGTVATGNTHKFTGHIQDAATGQYYAKARYFTTGLGRWSQPEPLLKGVPGKAFLYNPQKLNPYVYCLNNPISMIDPNGLTEIKITVARISENEKATMGKYNIEGTKIKGFTLERPWKNNGANVSRIPGGDYPTTRSESSKKSIGPDVLRLSSTDPRTDVLWHRGNTADDTKGCILPGKTSGDNRVENSRAAMNEIIINQSRI
jgi:RHS repeat-associated protein